MGIEEIRKDSKLISVLAAEAKNERMDSDITKDANDMIKELASDATPHNRYLISQAIAHVVSELQVDSNNYIQTLAHQKNIGLGDTAKFSVPTQGVRAYIQAKGATTPRSMIVDKQVTVDTVSVSARPAVNLLELKSGKQNMADLIRSANFEITSKKAQYIQQVLTSAVSSKASPVFASGSGVVAATLDAQLMHYRRLGKVVLLGDYAITDRVMGVVGHPTSGVSDTMFDRYHQIGTVGFYKGNEVMTLGGGYQYDGKTPVFDPAYLYIMSVSAMDEQRNLKVVNEGDVISIDVTHIDNLLYEVRLDQLFGAAYLLGSTPTIGIYEDTTL